MPETPEENADLRLGPPRSNRVRRLLALVCTVAGSSCLSLVICSVFDLAEPVGAVNVPLLSVTGAALLVTVFALMFIPTRWDCPRCPRRLDGNSPWRCAACGKEIRVFSFLNRCSNYRCWAKPTAYECEKCGALSYFTAARNMHRRARSLSPFVAPTVTGEETRRLRLSELDERAHRQQHLEADKRQFGLEVDIVKLKRELNKKEPVPMTAREVRAIWLADQFEDIRDKIRTIEQAVEEQRAMKDRAVAMGYDEEIMQQMSGLIDTHFESIRLKLHEPDLRV